MSESDESDKSKGAQLVQLYRKEHQLARDIRRVKQEICGLLSPGHNFKPYVEWSHSGDECTKCWHRVHKLCHHVNCKCSLPHSTDAKKDDTTSSTSDR